MYGREETNVTLTRQQLYDRVWSEPTSKIAKELGLSDVAIGKICRKFRVPKPPPGYWARVQNGWKPKTPSLPPENDPHLQQIRINVRLNDFNLAPLEPLFHSAIQAEESPEFRIAVSETLESPHPLVKKTKAAMKGGFSGPYGVSYPRDPGSLDISVSKSSLDRALRITDALVKALERRGHKIGIADRDQKRITEFFVHGEKLKFSVREEVTRAERGLTQKEKSELERNPLAYIGNKYIFSPTGRLIIQIETDFWSEGYKKRWADGDRQKLEDRLNALMAGLITAAHCGKQARLAREAEQRKWKEREEQARAEEKRRAEEKAKIDHLDKVLEAWKKSQSIRELVKAVELNHSPIEDGSDLRKWLDWAKGHADQIDPTIFSKKD